MHSVETHCSLGLWCCLPSTPASSLPSLPSPPFPSLPFLSLSLPSTRSLLKLIEKTPLSQDLRAGGDLLHWDVWPGDAEQLHGPCSSPGSITCSTSWVDLAAAVSAWGVLATSAPCS